MIAICGCTSTCYPQCTVLHMQLGTEAQYFITTPNTLYVNCLALKASHGSIGTMLTTPDGWWLINTSLSGTKQF